MLYACRPILAVAALACCVSYCRWTSLPLFAEGVAEALSASATARMKRSRTLRPSLSLKLGRPSSASMSFSCWCEEASASVSRLRGVADLL